MSSTPGTVRGSAMLRVIIMSLLLLMGMLNTGLVGPNRLSVQREYGLTHSQFGLGLAVVQIGATLLLFAATRLAARCNPMLLLAVSQLLQAVGLAVIFATHSIAALVGGWAVVAFGMRMNSISNSLSMALWPAEPRKGIILLHAYNALGKLSGPLLVAACIVLGWRFSFLVVAGVCTALFLLLFFVWRGGRTIIPRLDSRPPDTDAFRHPLYWIGIGCIMLIAGGETVFLTLYPSYLEQIHGYTPRMASLAFSVHLAGLAAGRFASAYALRRLTDNTIIALCLVSGLFILPSLFWTPPLLRYPSLFVFGFTFSSTWPTFFARLSAFFPGEDSALSYGAGFASTLGISLSILASSAIADHDITLALLTSPATMFTFGLIYFTAPFGRAPERKPT